MMKNELMDYLNKLSGGNLDDALELGEIASEAIVKHIEAMGASEFFRDVESGGVVYRVSVKMATPKTTH